MSRQFDRGMYLQSCAYDPMGEYLGQYSVLLFLYTEDLKVTLL
jgi:hypothetical protein